MAVDPKYQRQGIGSALVRRGLELCKARAGHPSRMIVRVASESAKGSGLLMDSVIMTDNLATIHYSEIDRVMGTFTGLNEIDAANDVRIIAARNYARITYYGEGPAEAGSDLQNGFPTK